jgi:origin recognition complex subunit 3
MVVCISITLLRQCPQHLPGRYHHTGGYLSRTLRSATKPAFFPTVSHARLCFPNFSDSCSHVETLLEGGEASIPKRLLDSNQYLLEYLKEQIMAGHQALEKILSTVEMIMVLQKRIPALQQQLKSTLLVDALAGQLRESNFEKNMFMLLKKSNSEALLLTLQDLSPTTSGDLHKTCITLLQELETLQAQQTDGGALRSEQDLRNSTLRTTVVAKKVELSKQKSTLTKSDAAYSDILGRFNEALETHFDAILINPKDLVFNEIFVYDLKSPHRDVFTPKPRAAIERALASPHDYLDCECCAPDAGTGVENTLAATQPSTAVLYQLYLEGGASMNVADLRTAFVTIVGDEQDEVLTK